jgi:hypothetical protein
MGNAPPQRRDDLPLAGVAGRTVMEGKPSCKEDTDVAPDLILFSISGLCLGLWKSRLSVLRIDFRGGRYVHMQRVGHSSLGGFAEARWGHRAGLRRRRPCTPRCNRESRSHTWAVLLTILAWMPLAVREPR